MSILLTGATGTIGRALLAELGPGRAVRTFGRRRPERSDGGPATPPDLDHVDGDLTDAAAVRAAADGVDAIVHLAGVLAGQDPLRTYEVDLRGTYHVLEAARAQGVPRVIIASSIATSGCLAPGFVPDRVRIREDDPCRPADPYSACKVASEVLCAAAAAEHGLTTVAVRVAGVMRPETLEAPAWETERSPILWTWISPHDAARAFIAALDAPLDGATIATVAADDTCSLRPTRELLASFLPSTAISPDVDGDDPRWTLFDTARARRLLGWTPRDRFDALYRGGVPA